MGLRGQVKGMKGMQCAIYRPLGNEAESAVTASRVTAVPPMGMAIPSFSASNARVRVFCTRCSATFSTTPAGLLHTTASTPTSASVPAISLESAPTSTGSTGISAATSSGQHSPSLYGSCALLSPELRERFEDQCSFQRKRSRDKFSCSDVFGMRAVGTECTSFTEQSHLKRVRSINSNAAISSAGWCGRQDKQQHFYTYQQMSHLAMQMPSHNSSLKGDFFPSDVDFCSHKCRISRKNVINQDQTYLSQSAVTLYTRTTIPNATTASSATISKFDERPDSSPLARGRSPFLLNAKTNAIRSVSRKRQNRSHSPESKRPSLFHRPWEAYPTELEKAYSRLSSKQRHSGHRHTKLART